MRKVLVFLAVAAFAMPSFAGDPVIWDNGLSCADDGLIVVTANGYASQDDPSTDLFAESADDFKLTAPMTGITDVHWEGIHSGVVPPDNVVSWLFDFYDDAGGLPAVNPFASYSVPDTALISKEPCPNPFGLPGFVYAAELPDVLWVEPDVNYWLSIRADYDRSPDGYGQWFYSVHDEPVQKQPTAFRSTTFGVPDWVTGSYLFGTDRDHNFRLTGIPEPATLALLSLGGLALIRRR